MMLYVHVPFCRSKCAFCDYVQPIPASDLLLRFQQSKRQGYIEAVGREIQKRGEDLADRPWQPRVIYWGGGTASDLSVDEARFIMETCRESFDLSEIVEATIECSPDTIDPAKLAFYRLLGFNRISLGAQSFCDHRLRKLGRLHDAARVREAVQESRRAGFDNVNVDIMCGFTDETVEETRHTISEALRLEVDHISLYSFRPTPGTAVRRRIDRGQDHLTLHEQRRSFALGRAMISAAGYDEYALGYYGRLSLFAQFYFQLSAALIGFGSGAMSLYDQRFRTHGKGRLQDYIDDPMHYDVDLPASADPVVIANLRAGLSYFDGIVRTQWKAFTGADLQTVAARPVLAPIVQFLRDKGLVEDERGWRLPPDRIGQTMHELNFRLLTSA